MSGLDLLEKIRSDSSCDVMKVMMVTTESEAEQLDKALQVGADEYVMKPFTREIGLDKLQMIGFSQ